MSENTKVWFTGDTHFGHQRTLELSKRPFKTVEEMNQKMIDNWNEVVKNEDTVYHIGDFGDYEISNKLNGKIILLFGNYERKDISEGKVTTEEIRTQFNFYKVYYLKQLKFEDMILVHEPSHINKEVFCLFGHIHKLQMVKRNALNVGVDCHNYYPIDMDTVSFYREAITKHYDDEVFN